MSIAAALGCPRSLDYFVLRACERMHCRPSEFDRLDLDGQLRLLAYDAVRRAEEAAGCG